MLERKEREIEKEMRETSVFKGERWGGDGVVVAVALAVSSSWTLLDVLSPLGISFHFLCRVDH